MTLTEARRAIPFLLLPLVLLVAGCGIAPWGPLGTPSAPVSPSAAASPSTTVPVEPTPIASAAPAPSFAPFPAGHDDLQQGQQAWAAANVRSYRWVVRFGCECLLNEPVQVTVVDGRVTDARTASGPLKPDTIAAFPLTVDDLYRVAREAIEGGGTATATWGTVPGIPAMLQTDPMPQAVDDELSITIQSFEPAS